MPAERYFINSPLLTEMTVILEDPEAGHLVKVMRGQEGEQVELVNGQDQLAQATVQNIEKKRVTLRVDTVKTQPRSYPKVIICQAIPRLQKLDTIFEKGTELGMTDIWLFPGMKSEKTSLNEQQLHRMEMIMIAALKQCGRLDLPKITIKPALKSWKREDLLFPAYFGDVSPGAPSFLKNAHPSSDLMFFIGPESGFAKEEIKHLQAIGAQGVKLHPYILRTETASLVALSLIFSHFQN